MTALLHRRGGAVATWLVAGAVIASAVVGIVAGVSPKYAIEAVLGIGFVILVFADLALGVAIFAALSFLSDITSGSSALSFDKVIGLLLIVSWALRRATSGRRDGQTVIGNHSTLFAWIVAFLAWSTISAMWAVSSSIALRYVFVDVLDLLLIPVVYGAVNSRRDAYVIVAGFLVGGIVTALYGLAHPLSTSAAQAGRFSSAAGDANQTATDLAAALMMAAGLSLVAVRSAKLRVLVLAAALLSFIGIIQTLSRSGLLALAAALLAGVAFGGRWRRQAVRLLVIGVVVVVGYFVFIAPAGRASRVTSSNTTGRSTIWTVAWRMFEANPILGVGTGNFQNASRQYLDRPGLTASGNYIITTPEPAHNVYLETARDARHSGADPVGRGVRRGDRRHPACRAHLRASRRSRARAAGALHDPGADRLRGVRLLPSRPSAQAVLAGVRDRTRDVQAGAHPARNGDMR